MNAATEKLEAKAVDRTVVGRVVSNRMSQKNQVA